jgi:hypothetical protein
MHPKITKCLGTDKIAQAGNVMMYFKCSKVIVLCSFLLELAITVLHNFFLPFFISFFFYFKCLTTLRAQIKQSSGHPMH